MTHFAISHHERTLISNPITGAQFMGKECHSHYHAHMKNLKVVDNLFSIHHLLANSQGACDKAHNKPKNIYLFTTTR